MFKVIYLDLKTDFIREKNFDIEEEAREYFFNHKTGSGYMSLSLTSPEGRLLYDKWDAWLFHQ